MNLQRGLERRPHTLGFGQHLAPFCIIPAGEKIVEHLDAGARVGLARIHVDKTRISDPFGMPYDLAEVRPITIRIEHDEDNEPPVAGAIGP